MRAIVWAGVPIVICFTLAVISPVNLAQLVVPTVELSLVLGAIFYASLDRRSSFFVRAAIHLAITLYLFFSLLPFRALSPFFPDETFAFMWSMSIWLLIMVSQFFITCPRCKALYSLIFYDDTNFMFGRWYAPWITPECAQCGRNKFLPNDQERT